MNVVVPLPVAIEIRQEVQIIEAECIYIENQEQNIVICVENDSEIDNREKDIDMKIKCISFLIIITICFLISIVIYISMNIT